MLKRITGLIIVLVLIGAICIIGYVYYTYIKPEDRPSFVNSALDYLPFGEISQSVNTQTPQQNQTDTQFDNQGNFPVAIAPLRKITSEPVAGAGAITRSIDTVNESGEKVKKTVVSVRYIERGTGHINEIETESNLEQKITNTTIPKVYDALFGLQANSLVFRYTNNQDTIQTYGARIVVATSTNSGTTTTTQFKLEGSFLPQNINDFAVSPTKDRIVYIERLGEGAHAVVSTFTGGGKLEVFKSQLREWLVQWPLNNSIYLTTKPSADVPGYLYRAVVQNGTQNIVLGPINGLTTLVNTTGSHILYTQTSGNSFRTLAYETATGDTQSFPTTLPAEKCVWSTKEASVVYCGVPTIVGSGKYPDVWYQGQILFTDTIQKINVSTGVTQTISQPQTEVGESIDAVSLTLDQDENYLIFRNKKDNSLWQLRLKPLVSN